MVKKPKIICKRSKTKAVKVAKAKALASEDVKNQKPKLPLSYFEPHVRSPVTKTNAKPPMSKRKKFKPHLTNPDFELDSFSDWFDEMLDEFWDKAMDGMKGRSHDKELQKCIERTTDLFIRHYREGAKAEQNSEQK